MWSSEAIVRMIIRAIPDRADRAAARMTDIKNKKILIFEDGIFRGKSLP
jgi:hypothetical protein